MELRLMRSFVRVAELGSFSRAAIELRIAQPALSRQIAKLEAELGVALLYRTGRGVSLTSAGELLLVASHRLFADMDQTIREVRATSGLLAGSASIGLPPTVGRVLSIPLARRINTEFPDVKLRIVEGFSGNLVEWLYSGRVDVSVLYVEPNMPVMIAEPLVVEDLMLIGSPATLDPAGGAPIDMTAVAQLPLVVPSRPHSLRLHIDRGALDAGVALEIVLEVDALHSMIEAVRQGLACTILPPCAVCQDIEAGTLVARRIVSPGLHQTLYVATAFQRPSAVAPKRIAQVVRDAVYDLCSTGLWRRIEQG